MMRTKMAMPPMTPPTIAPALFLDEVVCVLDAEVLLRGGEVLVGLDETTAEGLLLLVTELADVEAVVEIVVASSCTRASSRASPFLLTYPGSPQPSDPELVAA